MKPFTIFFISLLICSFGFAQNLDKLDQKYGYLKFKLGTSETNYKNLKLDENFSKKYQNLKVYEYLGNDIKYIFGIEITTINLYFFQHKLFAILLYFGDEVNAYTEEQYEHVNNSLEYLYGTDWHNVEPSSSQVIKGRIWKAKKVTLEHIKSYNDFDEGENINLFRGYISIQEDNIHQKFLDNQF